MMIAGPLLALVPRHALSASSITIALVLTPVVIAVAEAATRHNSDGLAGRLWPGLAAVAGLLLVLAPPSLSSPGQDVVLLLAPLLTGFGAVLFCAARESMWRIPAALLGACIALGVAAAANVLMHIGGLSDMSGLAAGFDALQALLSLLAVGRISAIRWSAQFAIVPLLVLAEALIFMPSSVAARMIIGLLLLGFAAVAMLIPPSVDPGLKLEGSVAHSSQTD